MRNISRALQTIPLTTVTSVQEAVSFLTFLRYKRKEIISLTRNDAPINELKGELGAEFLAAAPFYLALAAELPTRSTAEYLRAPFINLVTPLFPEFALNRVSWIEYLLPGAASLVELNSDPDHLLGQPFNFLVGSRNIETLRAPQLELFLTTLIERARPVSASIDRELSDDERTRFETLCLDAFLTVWDLSSPGFTKARYSRARNTLTISYSTSDAPPLPARLPETFLGLNVVYTRE
jgi:hypothetical protein